MLADGVETMEATEEAADSWVEKVRERWDATLLSQGKISMPVPHNLIVLIIRTVGGLVPISQARKFSL